MALPKQSEDFPAWYQAVVKGAELAEPSLVRGTMVIRPYGFAIWERIQQAVDRRIKLTGHQNLYFPMLIPAKLLEKEAEHVEGFAPEVAVVTHAGGEKLEEPLIIRPTSETIIWDTYARWIQSYRDLPLLYNQWANVVRWELRPRLFLRTTEFLWQEGHTAHETSEEAMAEARTILDKVYRDAVEDDLAIPVRLGRKSASERFAGAEETFTIEALMRDGRALQSGTSHYLGQNFARAYDVRFLGREGKEEYAWASSWGVSTRLVGALIMAHGDDAGLRLPPALAPIQVVIVPIYRSDEEKEAVNGALWPLVDALQAAGVRAFTDDREEHRPGYKFNEWELKGVPVRLELGPKDVAKAEVVLYRRDLREKSAVPLEGIAGHVLEVLDSVQGELFAQALAFRESRTFRPATYEELKALIQDPGGFVEGLWCGRPACEDKVKADTRATIRTLTLDPVTVEGTCIVCGEPATELAVWAQAY
ncbi:MAG TPA: proline--tRNA ligase [Actinomycetota bacterium]|nr:proline--tRNA ligase [Actinomycetota bacterium]